MNPFESAAGRLCLEFANTVSGRRGRAAEDRLQGYADFVAWAGQAGALPPPQVRALIRAARRQPAAASEVLHQARALREAIYGVLAAVATRRLPRADDLTAINAAVVAAVAGSRIVRKDGSFVWAWTGDRRALDRVLWPLATSAAQVLTSSDVAFVRECATPECGRLFLDASRNGTRRWCDMTVCGNRAKARRFYARRRSIRARSAGGKS